MTPVFLIISGRLEDTNDLLQQILTYLQESIFPLLYEIRDVVTGESGSQAPAAAGESPLISLIVVLLMAVGFLCGIQLFRIFAARIRG